MTRHVILLRSLQTQHNLLEDHKHCTRWWTHRWSVLTGI